MKNKSNVITIILIASIIVIILSIAILVGIAYFKKDKSKNVDEENETNKVLNQAIKNPNKNSIEKNETDENNNIVTNSVDINELLNGLTQTNSVPQQSTQPSPVKKVYYKEFVRLGTIEISKTGISYPILDDISQQALEVAVGVLYPTNARLNEPGNVVIIGHNYKNGKFFANNKKLQVGDKIKITDNNAKSLTYTIYEIFETTPEDTEYITRERPEGSVEISLSTCTDDVKNRLIILARAN